MRRQVQGNGQGQGARLGWLLLAVACAAALWGGAALAARRGQESGITIPNDLFASVPAAAAPLQRMVCLTFDDGPSRNTAPILKILEENDVLATFFVTAQEVNADYLPLTADIVAQGHQLALHSACHEYKTIYASTEAFWLDIKALRRALEPYVETQDLRWLRFPGGSTNTVSHRYGGRGIMKELIRQAEEKGYHWIDWNVSAEDATRSRPDAERILQNIQHDAEGRDICVVLMHDTKATDETVRALPDIIGWFRQQGYQFLTVEQMQAAKDAASAQQTA